MATKNIGLLVLVFTVSTHLLLIINASSQEFKPSSPFSAALDTLQNQIGYAFKRVNLLRRAMTHPSYSGENNRALSILGLSVVETSVSLHSLQGNIDISPKDLNLRIKEISDVDSCAVVGLRFGLEKIVRVSPKINSSTPSIVCGTYRAIFGAISVDTGKADEAGSVFWNVTHPHRNGDRAYPM